MNKIVIRLLAGALLSGVIAFGVSAETKAALPSTYDIINDANGNIAKNTAGYEAAKANEAALKAAFDAVKANPAHTLLEYEKAAADYTNAVNVSQWWLAQLNNSKEYLKNISDRGAFEDKFAANKAALADLTTLKASKFDSERANNMANGAAERIADVERAIAGYQTMLATCPSMQAQIDELNVKLAVLKADYAAKAAVAAEMAATFNNNLNTLNYGAFDLDFENYQHNREWQREDPEHYDVKNQKWIGSDVPFFKNND